MRSMNKHLTDAELAAEYWRLRADLNGMARITDSPIEIDRKATIMHRFATTPNAGYLITELDAEIQDLMEGDE